VKLTSKFLLTTLNDGSSTVRRTEEKERLEGLDRNSTNWKMSLPALSVVPG